MSETRQLFGKVGVFFVMAALLVGCELFEQEPAVVDPPEPNVVENPVVVPEELVSPRVYWLKDEGDRLSLTPTKIAAVQETREAQLTSLFEELLSTTPDAELSSTIPAGTELLSLTVQPDGVVVNLSEDFQLGGGSSSMMGRLGQVVYTATSLDPDAPVWLQIEGEPLELLGGEGLEIAQPMTREIFTTEFDL
ncbi:MAG: spore germination protein [Limnothrix sp. RL_2_0]|nr:spore germination protein [Limnothrix sp. RL_2_0]